jgi:membrane protease YdiL (CAAX protease family)
MNPFQKIELTLILVYLAYFLITLVNRLKQAHNLIDGLKNGKSFSLILSKFLCGIFLFSIPLILFPASYSFLLFNSMPISGNYGLPWFILLIAIFIISYSSALKQKKSFVNSRNSLLPDVMIITYWPIRLTFLFFYELFFRGYLLFTLIQYKGLVIAIIINTILYVIIHLFDSKNEIIGSIPFGIILCLITYYSQSIWPSFIMHAILAGAFESIIMFYEPFKNRKT